MCWICDHPDATDAEYHDHIRKIIGEFGWAVQAVQGDGIHPPLAYTVGLTSRGLPELVVTGLDETASGYLLNQAAADLEQRVIREPGQRLRLSGGELAEVVAVAVPDAHLKVAAAMYGDALLALQLVIADANGRWPWANGYQGGSGGQPVLGSRGH